jgi:integrase
VQITTGGIDAAIRFLLGDPVIASLLADAPPDYGQMTLREYQEAVWWPIRSGVRKDPAIRTVSEHTVRTEAGYWRQILDAIGHHRLRDLQDDPWIWERYMGGMVQPGRTKVLHRSAYKALLDHAHRRRHIERVHSFWTVVGSTQRVKALEEPLTLEEVARLLSVSSPMRRAMWSVAVGQGLRPSELVRCRWEDLNVTDGVMSVRGDPARGGKGKTEMSASRIPLTPLTARELGRYQEHLNSTGQAPLGEMWTFNGKPIISYKKSLARHAAAAGITKHVTPYLLRHSFASIAWELGIEKDAARCILRHTSERMLDEVYARPRPSAIRERLLAFDLPVAAPEEVVDGDDDGEDVGEERVFTE